MKRLLGIIVAIAAVAGAYKLKYPTYTYRYRMTMEVDAGGEVRSRSSVIEVGVIGWVVHLIHASIGKQLVMEFEARARKCLAVPALSQRSWQGHCRRNSCLA
jgi:hypothetical protein